MAIRQYWLNIYLGSSVYKPCSLTEIINYIKTIYLKCDTIHVFPIDMEMFTRIDLATDIGTNIIDMAHKSHDKWLNRCIQLGMPTNILSIKRKITKKS